MNHRNIIRYALSFKNFVDNCFIDINNIKNLPNVFLRSIGEIIMVTNLKLHTFLKSCVSARVLATGIPFRSNNRSCTCPSTS